MRGAKTIARSTLLSAIEMIFIPKKNGPSVEKIAKDSPKLALSDFFLCASSKKNPITCGTFHGAIFQSQLQALDFSSTLPAVEPSQSTHLVDLKHI